jgi:DNA repair exonuclease SbcCD ATPase subunit
MIKQLNYSVTFPSTGRTLSEAVLFQGGFGAIVGPNESGKTMIVEMVRFCLFGSAALRGTAEDYKNLKASLDFTVRSDDYLVERTGTKAQLKENGEVVAVGIKPVNLKIAQILGFGLTVFDMACVANQNQLLALGEMTPADRRRAVDSVIGVSILDDLAKGAGTESLALKRAADDLQSNTREPIAPMEPAGYRPSVELEVEKEALDLVRSAADQLRGWLANEKKKPGAPQDKHKMSSDLIQGLVEAQNARNIERQLLEGELARIPAAANITLEEIEEDERKQKQHELFLARRQFLTFHPRPQYTKDELDQQSSQWKAFRNQEQITHLQKKRDDLLNGGKHVCPSCTHEWPAAADAIDEVNKQISVLDQNPKCLTQPALSEIEIDRQQRFLDGWDEAEWQKHANSPEQPTDSQWTVQDRVRHRHGLEGKARRAELLAQIDQLKPAEKEPDWPSILREVQQYEAQLNVYAGQLAEFEEWQTEKSQKLVQLTMLEMDLQGYDELVLLLTQARNHEQLLTVYAGQLRAYQTAMDTVAGYRTEADDWNKVKDALQILRSKIKQYLVPSLNRVASSLISHMTGGERQAINVDEEFNILVDGQTIDTLSGSGKAVANLALRIGLGQVLTNNIFSLFMGDEIDESMDKNRADKTAGVMHTLKGRISQLLLVSHKSPSADYFIAVGENSEYQLSNDQPD